MTVWQRTLVVVVVVLLVWITGRAAIVVDYDGSKHGRSVQSRTAEYTPDQLPAHNQRIYTDRIGSGRISFIFFGNFAR